MQLPSSWKVVAFTVFLLCGLTLSQVLGVVMDAEVFKVWSEVITSLTMWALSFIMINVGYEFTFDKNDLATYGWDYLIAMTAAGFPWLFVALWYLLVIPGIAVDEAFLVARFAAPTSAGILFSMLEAAGLRETWVFQKARILAIFDDLDTILLMIPLKVLMIGFKWELVIVIAIMAILLGVAYWKLHALRLPHAWYWTLFYAAIIAAVCKVVHYVTHHYIDMEPIHIEVLLPAFVMGCVVDNAVAREELKLQRQSTMEKKELKKLSKMASFASSSAGGSQVPAALASSKASAFSSASTVTSSDGEDSLRLQHASDLKKAANAEADKGTANGKVVQPVVEGAAVPPGQVMEAWQVEDKQQESALAAQQYGRRPARNSRRNISKESAASASSAGSKESRLSRHGVPKPDRGAHDDLHEEDKWEHVACTVVSMVFMVLVGLTMPPLVGEPKTGGDGHRRLAGSGGGDTKEKADVQEMAAELIVAHVIAVSVLMVLGKMFPAVCYRDEATFKERFALCLGMCPRGEVGASIIVISLELGVQGPSVIISMFALVINLVMSGGFIGMVKCLIRGQVKQPADTILMESKVQETPKFDQDPPKSSPDGQAALSISDV